MNDKPIGVGDLVVVVRHHDCDPSRGVGTIFTVEGIERAVNWHCMCRFILCDGTLLARGLRKGKVGFHPILWLKRIPPLSELDGERTQEDMKESA